MVRSIVVGCVSLAVVSYAALSCGVAQGALFSGSASFSTVPWSQMGPVTNNLVITDLPNGFVVSGQVLVSVPPGPSSGILVAWTIDRPLDPTYGSGVEITSTLIDGFSAPPIGVIGSSGGLVYSEFTSNPGASFSGVALSLTAGAATWNNLVSPSPPFAYTSSTGHFLRQEFFLDGVQFSGPGGTWVIDVPVTSFVTTVPEPATVSLVGIAALCGLAVWWRRRRPVAH